MRYWVIVKILLGVWSVILCEVTLFASQVQSAKGKSELNDAKKEDEIDYAINFTEKERRWIKEHNGTIRLAPDPKFAPYEFFDNESIYRGMGADYIHLLEEKIGIKFDIVELESWTAVIEGAKRREVDVFGLAGVTSQRLEYMDFVFPHIHAKGVIVSRKEISKELSMEDLTEMNVCVVKNYFWHERIVLDYPEINLTPVENIIEGLRKVSFGMADAMVISIATSSYHISQEGYSNLKIAGDTPYSIPLAIAVRNDWPELVSIINKGFAKITQTEKKAIFEKWVFHREIEFYQTEKFWNAMMVIIITSVVLFFLILIFNYRLKKSVNHKTNELKKEKDKLKQSNDDLLIALDKAAESDRLTKAFLANISHEVRTPMNSILGFVEILEMNGVEEENRGIYAGHILKSGQQLLAILDNIINISKIESGFIKPRTEEVDARVILKETFELFHLVAKTAKLDFILNLPEEDVNMMILSDEVLLHQVLNNLVSNAIKYTPKGKIVLGCKRNDDMLKFFVRDSGVGIPEEYKTIIFEPFKQVDRNHSVPVGGAGLGLAIASRLVVAMGGTMWVESEYTKGSTFFFTCPVHAFV